MYGAQAVGINAAREKVHASNERGRVVARKGCLYGKNSTAWRRGSRKCEGREIKCVELHNV